MEEIKGHQFFESVDWEHIRYRQGWDGGLVGFYGNMLSEGLFSPPSGNGPPPSPSRSRASTTRPTLTTSRSPTSFSQVGGSGGREEGGDLWSPSWSPPLGNGDSCGLASCTCWRVAPPGGGGGVTLLCLRAASATEPDFKSKDWVFLNYTYKRFEGLTQRGTIPTYMKAGKA